MNVLHNILVTEDSNKAVFASTLVRGKLVTSSSDNLPGALVRLCIDIEKRQSETERLRTILGQVSKPKKGEFVQFGTMLPDTKFPAQGIESPNLGQMYKSGPTFGAGVLNEKA